MKEINISKSSQLIYAGPDEEFFWHQNDKPVEEGVAVGYEVEREETLFDQYSIDLILFDNFISSTSLFYSIYSKAA